MSDISSEFERDTIDSSRDEEIVFVSDKTIIKKVRTFGKWQIHKEITQKYAFDAKHRVALEQEFEIGYQLDHPNIVRYLDKKYSSDGVPTLVMEFVDGYTLRQIIESDEKCSKKEFDAIFTSILLALSYLQQKQVYHLDIKPENIIVSHKDGIAKLIDFGFAITSANEVALGTTQQYKAPEFSKSTIDISGKTDMYSFAKTMMEFAKSKHLRLNFKQRKIVRLCLQENPEKRLNATKALQVLQEKSRIWILGVSVICVLGIGAYLLKNKESVTTFTTVEDSINSEEKISDSDSIKLEIVTSSKKQFDDNKQTANTNFNEKIENATAIVKDDVYRDSILLENIAKQKVEAFASILQHDSLRQSSDLNEVKLQFSNEYKHAVDSISTMYMKKNQFEMSSSLANIGYAIFDKIDAQMDSLKNQF